jgi:hypothetical protein
MTGLSEHDRKAILGENWRTMSEPASNDAVAQVERKVEAQKKSAVDQQFNAVALVLMGVALATASLYRAGASPYEYFLGIGVVVIGLSWLTFLGIAKSRRS